LRASNFQRRAGERTRSTTNLIKGAKETREVIERTVSNARRTICAVSGSSGASLAVQSPFLELRDKATPNGVKVKLITEITKDNLAACVALSQRAVETRHLDRVKGNFLVTESEFLRGLTPAQEDDSVPEIIHSDMKEVVDESQFLFDTLWDKAIPSELRFNQLRDAQQTGDTRLTFNSEQVFDAANKFIGQMKEEALVFVPREGAIVANTAFFQRLAAQAASTGARVRILARFSKEETTAVRKFERMGLELRAPGSRQRFNLAIGIYDRRSMALMEQIPEAAPQAPPRYLSGMVSTDAQLVDWVAGVFEMFWDSGVPLEDAIAEVESGVEPPRLRVFRDRTRVRETLLQNVKNSRSQILLLLPSTRAFHRLEAIGAIESLWSALDRGVSVMILTPLDEGIEETVQRMKDKRSESSARFDCRRIPEATTPNTVTVLVVDRTASLVVEQKDDSQKEFIDSIGDATYSTRNSTVASNIRFFERMWEEVELREREEDALRKERRSRKAAELLQDILAHDIRNYNQVSKLSAELLKTGIENTGRLNDQTRAFVDDVLESADPSSPLAQNARRLKQALGEGRMAITDSISLVGSIMRATDGSGNLIDRAKKLGKIVSQEHPQLVPVELEGVTQRAAQLVAAAHPDRSLLPSFSVEPGARVVADEMLEEVFTNLFSNAAKYTDGYVVPLEVRVEQATLNEDPAPYWKVQVTDRGKGIPDSMKEQLFTRYLNTASGTGLGLSIVYALVVVRYSGRIKVADRVPGDSSQGTRIELWLPKAS
jgi:signal transduction histidine kinase